MNETQGHLEETAQSILDLIFDMRAITGESRQISRQRETNAYHLKRVSEFVRCHQPVRMILPAFPAKSPNREKTLGSHPDLGEVLALKRLQKLCDDVRELYSPGAEIVICSDGRVFSDIVHVPDDEVTEYTKSIAQIVQTQDLRSLRTFNLEDAFADCETYPHMRERLFATYAETVESIREGVGTRVEERSLFNGMHRFLFEDLVALEPRLSRSQAREQSKQATYQLLQRSHAWSRFVEEHFAGAVRLSIHPQPLGSRKIGIRLLPSENIWRTPWHSVAIFDGQDYRLTTRAEAEQNGAIRMMSREGYEFFVGVPPEARGGEYVAFA